MNYYFDSKAAKLFLLSLYFSVFVIIAVYLLLNPHVGRDYFSYIDIVERVVAGDYFREPAFSLIVICLSFFNVSPEVIIYSFRLLCIFLIMRFFYKSKTPLFGLFFFIFVPNILIGSFNALQTWLAIAVFIQVFCSEPSHYIVRYRSFMFLSLLSSLFHVAGLLFFISFFVYWVVGRWGRFLVGVLYLLVFPVGFFIFDFVLGYLGFSKYLISLEPVSNGAFILSTAIVIVTFFFSRYVEKDFCNVVFSMLLVYLSISMLLFYYAIEQQIFLRLTNFILPIFYISLSFFVSKFELNQRVVVFIVISIVFTANFLNTVISIPHDMLNFSQIRNIFY